MPPIVITARHLTKRAPIWHTIGSQTAARNGWSDKKNSVTVCVTLVYETYSNLSSIQGLLFKQQNDLMIGRTEGISFDQP